MDSVGAQIDPALRPRFCRECAYNLAGHAGPKCPECGRGFDPANARTFDASPHRRRREVMWRWVGGLVLLAAVLWAMWPRSIVHVTLACVSPSQSRGVRATVVHGPAWLGATYFTWTRDDPDALGKLTAPAQTDLTWLQCHVSEHDSLGSAPTTKFTFTIGVNLTNGHKATLSVGANSESPRSMPLTEAQLDDAARFIARHSDLARAGVSIRTQTPASK